MDAAAGPRGHAGHAPARRLCAALPISRNILTRRLAHLVRHRVFARVDAGTHGTRYEYELTAMGRDLRTVMTALRQ